MQRILSCVLGLLLATHAGCAADTSATEASSDIQPAVEVNALQPVTPEEVIRAYIDAYNKTDLQAAERLLTPNFVRYSNTTSTWEPMGRAKWAEMWASFDAAFPDIHWEVLSFVAVGETVAIEVIETATFTKPWVLPDGSVIQPTGKGYSSHNSLFFTVNSAGLIENYRQYAGLAFLSVGLKPSDILRIASGGL